VNLGVLTIKLKTAIFSDCAEMLEEELRDFLRSFGVEAVIEDSITGNTTLTDDREDEENSASEND
jgi:hypothetical protein